MGRLSKDEVDRVRGGALEALRYIISVLKECEGEVASGCYVKEKLDKASGWIRIINDYVKLEEQNDDTL